MTSFEDGMLMVELFYHKVIDTKESKKRYYRELRYIDPQKIKKGQRKISGKPNPITGVEEKQKKVRRVLHL